jgi:hypothetical protein
MLYTEIEKDTRGENRFCWRVDMCWCANHYNSDGLGSWHGTALSKMSYLNVH